MLPITSGEITFPATRTIKSSPKFASKISSGGTRESAQPRMVAYGCWALARAARVSLHTVGKCALPLVNRLFPSISLCSPCSADNTVFSVHGGPSLHSSRNKQHPTPAGLNATGCAVGEGDYSLLWARRRVSNSCLPSACEYFLFLILSHASPSSL